MHFATLISSLFPIVLVGVLIPFLARTRRGIIFGVTLPINFTDSSTARASIRRYLRDSTLIVVLVIFVTAFSVTHNFGKPWTLIFAPFATLLELGFALLFWLRENRTLRPYTVAAPLERRATLAASQAPFPNSGAFLAAVASLLPLATSSIWLHLHWANIPARWPQHWNAAGHVDGWGTNTPASVYAPQIMGAVIVLLMIAVMLFISLSPGAMTKQRRVALAPLAGLAWLISGMFVLISLLPLKQGISVSTIVTLIVAHTIATFAVVIWLIWRSLQATSTTEPYDGTPDSMWHFGIFYYNPADAAVLVPKRFGIGWTFNYARPLAWVFTIGILLVAAGSGLIPFLLKSRPH